MSNTQTPDVTAEEIAKSQKRWAGFTKLLTWGTLSTIAIVIFLALVTL